MQKVLVNSLITKAMMLFIIKKILNMNLYIHLFFLLLFITPCTGQSTWEQIADYPSSGLQRVFSFELDGLVYVGTGQGSSGNVSSVWAYDIETDTWTAKASFPGGNRRNAFGFQVGGYGYVGTGYDGSSHRDDFWKYDPIADSWTQLADFPGGNLSNMLALANDSKAYVLTGGRGGDSFANDAMWEFDPVTETWTELENFPGIGRWFAFGWIIDQKLYVGGGNALEFSQVFTDIYCFDIATGNWLDDEIAACPTSKATSGFFFSIQGKGYYLEGNANGNQASFYGKKMFVYDPVTNSWTEEVDFIGTERAAGFSCAVGDKGIIGLGSNASTSPLYRNEVYAFTPGVISSTDQVETINTQLFPNPVTSSTLNIEGKFNDYENIVFTLFDASGRAYLLSTDRVNRVESNLIQVNVGHLIPGLYQLEMNMNNKQKTTLQFIKQ